MKYRTYRNTDLNVSEVGFGMWTVSTGWWGSFTEQEAVNLMRKAFDLGITLYDAADTYGNGLSKEWIRFCPSRERTAWATRNSPGFFAGGNGACHRICPETAQDKSNRPFATSQYPHGASERRYGLGNARKAA